jgi:hypothetical protein
MRRDFFLAEPVSDDPAVFRFGKRIAGTILGSNCFRPDRYSITS